jgi:hypothetical protein
VKPILDEIAASFCLEAKNLGSFLAVDRQTRPPLIRSITGGSEVIAVQFRRKCIVTGNKCDGQEKYKQNCAVIAKVKKKKKNIRSTVLTETYGRFNGFKTACPNLGHTDFSGQPAVRPFLKSVLITIGCIFNKRIFKLEVLNPTATLQHAPNWGTRF